MTMTINGSGTITGLTAGGLPSATVTQATLATPVAGTGPAFSAYSASNQSISANVATKVICGTEDFDTNSNYDNTNGRFTPTVAGYYQMTGTVESNNAGADAYFIATLYKNGTKVISGTNFPTNASAGPLAIVTGLIYCNGSTDYIELYGQRVSASTFYSGTGTRFQGVMVRSA